MNSRADQLSEFTVTAGWGDARRTAITGDASSRRYERLTRVDGSTAILMDAPPDTGEDVRPFVRMVAYLADNGLSAPDIYSQDASLGALLIEDLGDALFARLMKRDPTREETLYRAATDVLIQLHQSPTITLPVCDADWLCEMTAPVFEWYAPDRIEGVPADFENVFRPLATRQDAEKKVVILRDYHAENLIWLPDRKGAAKVGLLDFQDALLGHPAYDLVSVLQDARRDVDPDIEAQMIAHYLTKTGLDADAFRAAYALIGAQRNLRIVGIFARLCLRDAKPHYVDMIPRVWDHAMRDLHHPDLADVADYITATLPPPTAKYLEALKKQCATRPLP